MAKRGEKQKNVKRPDSMKICVCHTDLRLYWPDRLVAFEAFCRQRGAELAVVEISGKGSPYSFAGERADQPSWWHCLYPDKRMEDLNFRECTRKVGEKLTELNIDVVIAGALAFPSGAGAVRWGVRTGGKVVIMDNARRVDVPRSWFVNWIKRRIYQEVDAVLLPAQSHTADYRFWGIKAESMHFGLNVVNNDFFVDGVRAVRKLAQHQRPGLGLPERYLLGVGRQVAKKNWMELLNAFGSFRERCPGSNLDLVLLGNGPERAALEDRARAAGLKGVYFRDFAMQEDLVRFYALAKAVVLPSRTGETWGLVVNEAMASGLPVLVTRQCGCTSTLVREGENGWVMDAEKRGTMEEAIRSLAATPRKRLVEMGETSLRFIRDWGLTRFCEGAWTAAQQASATAGRPANPVNAVLVKLWNGRYRPT